jgi:flagellar hook assembly protein FlgD
LPGAGLPLVSVHPNPFNPRATVTIELARPGVVVLSIVAATGERVLRREMGSLAAGRHELTWDGRDGAGRAVPSGTYLVKAEAGGLSATTRATLVR